MNGLNKTEIKKAFFNVLSPYFENIGFDKYLTSGDPTYVLNKKNLVVSFFFNFYSNNSIGRSPFRLTHYEVENYILNIGIPRFDIDEYKKKKKYHLSTVNFKVNPESLKKVSLYTIIEIEEFAQSFIKFYENEGQAFIDQYSYLPNVLKEMDRLEAENLYWKEILSGGPDYLFRGVIISKLCNDANFNKKILFVNSLLKSSEDWAPYWAKLKEVLPSIQPKYNV